MAWRNSRRLRPVQFGAGDTGVFAVGTVFIGVLVEGDEVGTGGGTDFVHLETEGFFLFHENGVVFATHAVHVNLAGEELLEQGVGVGGEQEGYPIKVRQLGTSFVFLEVVGIGRKRDTLIGAVFADDPGTGRRNGGGISVNAPEVQEAVDAFAFQDGLDDVHRHNLDGAHVEQTGVNICYGNLKSVLIESDPFGKLAADGQGVTGRSLNRFVVNQFVDGELEVVSGQVITIGPAKVAGQGVGDGLLISGDLPAFSHIGLPLEGELVTLNQSSAEHTGDIGGAGFFSQNRVEGFGTGTELTDNDLSALLSDFPTVAAVDNCESRSYCFSSFLSRCAWRFATTAGKNRGRYEEYQKHSKKLFHYFLLTEMLPQS
jgi:hypothetical protein